MDKRSKTIAVVKALHQFHDKTIDAPEIIKSVCDYFDSIKSEKLDESDLHFLKQIANTVGIPHYFDNLGKFQKDSVTISSFSLSTISAEIYESTLHTSNDDKIHKYQKHILDLFIVNKKNRYFLSASTSFGKTHLVYEILKKMKYNNIVLIFPTIALLSENLERIHSDKFYSSYNIHTLSDVAPEELASNNIFIYTPERFLSFIEKNKVRPIFNFIFIDEVYKIDNEYIIDEEEKQENERDVSYRIAAYYSVLGIADILLAGPYIEKYSSSFERFLSDNRILKCDFNRYEIVGKSYHEIKTAKKIVIDDHIIIEFDKGENGKHERLKAIISAIPQDESSIIYCTSPPSAEKYAKDLPALIDPNSFSDEYRLFIEHVSKEYGEEWILTKCLKKGIGIHHGLIPKYIQKEIIYFFNAGVVKVLSSTTTITEGVNTSAKNLIITDNKKGIKPLKRFDAKNIAGRAGRFDRHYRGRVIVLKNKFLDDIKSDSEAINHKNYDLNSNKNEIDLFYSGDEFLTNSDKIKKKSILMEQSIREIPDDILSMFKIVNRADKIRVYDCIASLNFDQNNKIQLLVRRINTSARVRIDWDGFQIVLNCITSVVNENLKDLIIRKTKGGEGPHSILIPILNTYLESGFKGLVNYNIVERGWDIDKATRDASKFVYNTAKYQLVKYLGVFNIMYKFHRSKINGILFDDAHGIDRLLTKLEYNALTDIGRKASDYGVPAKVLQYYESEQSPIIRNTFDDFERKIFTNVERIIKRET